ncbi:hypothetical protein ES708_20254 [subsurface metagenome]
MMIPDGEYQRFKSFLKQAATLYGLTIDDYIKKVWYHEQAAKLGEYVALTLADKVIEACTTGEI